MRWGNRLLCDSPKHYGTGDVAGFNSLLFKLLGIAAVLGLGGIGVAVFFGHMSC